MKRKGRTNMKKFRLLTLLVLVLSILLVFAACDNADKNTEPPKSTNSPTQSPTETPTQNNTEHTHVFSDATCTTPKTCECGATEGNPKGHAYEDVVTAPTCTESGYTSHTCTCGDTYTDSDIDALGHTYENGVCKTCGADDPDHIAHTHSYASVVTNPTCTTAGYTTHTCACGETYTDNAIDALGHTFETGVCGACGASDPDYETPHTHDYDSVMTAPTCTKDGYTTYTCGCGDTYTDDEVAAPGHSYINGVCRACGASDPDYETPHTHDYDSVVTAPTCTKDGYTTYTCECGDTYTDDEIDALGHSYTNGVCGACGAFDPDHATPTITTTTITSSKLGIDNGVDVEGTVTSDGFIINATKNANGNTPKYYTNGEAIRIYVGNAFAITAPTGCTIQSIEFTAVSSSYSLEKAIFSSGTATTSGNVTTVTEINSDYIEFTNNNSGSDQMRVVSFKITYVSTEDAGGDSGETPHEHSYSSVVTPPTCTKEGYTTYSCDCDYTYTDNTVAALGHSYANGACGVCGEADPDYTPDVDDPVVGTETTVSKSHTDIAGIAGVTAGQSTGEIADQTIALDSYISIICAKGSSTSNPCVYDESIRLYQNGATLTIKAAEGATMQTIVISLASKSGGQGPITVTGGTASNLTNRTYTITVDAGVSEIVITTAGADTSSRLYVSNIAVTYTTGSTGGNGDNGGGDDIGGGDIGGGESGETPAEQTLATFDFGENASASHKDGSDLGESTSYTDGSYTLNLTNMSKVFGPAYDAKGNSCLKLGTGSVAGKFSFTVDENVTEVVICVAKYKNNTTKIKVNGTDYTISKASDNGEYDEIRIDTTANKTISLETVSGGYRCMINTIVFNGNTK